MKIQASVLLHIQSKSFIRGLFADSIFYPINS